MAANREQYDKAMDAGHEAAWNQNWAVAANAYGRALQEFPDDPEAHLNLGFALLRASRYDEALRVYSRAHQLTPDDPIPMEKSADVLEKMGRLKEAAEQYANVADVYLRQQDIDKAIGNWERATELTPGLVAIHAKLARAYQKYVGNRRRAHYHYLMLAYNLNRTGDVDQAKKAVQQALLINKKSIEALNALRALESGGVVRPPAPLQAEETDEKTTQTEVKWDSPVVQNEPRRVEADPLGPMGNAINLALTELAEHIMVSGGFSTGALEALQAMELQRQGTHNEAISLYQRASATLKHPALLMNLGALLLLTEQPNEAVNALNEASKSPNLQVGALHALGQAYYQQERYQQSASTLVITAEMIDRAQSKNDEELAEITTVYRALNDAIKKRGAKDETLGAVSKRFISLLRGSEWQRRLKDTRQQMAEANRDGGGQRIIEFLAEDSSEGVSESVALIDRYIRDGLYTLALDEAQHAIEKSPTYLPIHVRMAEVLMSEGRVRQAITKYTIIAKSYRARNENGRAASILTEVLEMAPLDVEVRETLIELFESESRLEEALDQYIELANTYRELGNFDNARTTYQGAERIAQQVNADVGKVVQIKHEIAQIEQARLDMRRAQRVYEEIIALAPNDERARRALVEVNMHMGNQLEAIKQLDSLLRVYAQRKQVKNILALLQDLVRSYPEDSGLRSRLAAIYRQLGRKQDAIAQLDKLIDVQLDAGLTQDACDTVKQIISLEPSDMRKYREMLISLGC
jgi:tetratricopeptide (TPR) repeat protein